jgi:tripartite-type tricarboxylate transporter receptor subunit TctC
MIVSRAFFLPLVVAVFLAAGSGWADDYPNRAVRFIVPFGAGGPTDVFTRALAEELRKTFNQSFIIDNRPGAGTIIGTAEAAKAAPDGYTLLMMSATQTTVETLSPNKPYKLMRDFVPVAALMKSELVMVARASLRSSSRLRRRNLARSTTPRRGSARTTTWPRSW